MCHRLLMPHLVTNYEFLQRNDVVLFHFRRNRSIIPFPSVYFHFFSVENTTVGRVAILGRQLIFNGFSNEHFSNFPSNPALVLDCSAT